MFVQSNFENVYFCNTQTFSYFTRVKLL
uniref:Uncharacterized protein n=1 Tax=Anguilla anguilla TaxID=7936 RepID=A0A0E9V8Y7_ANGAN